MNVDLESGAQRQAAEWVRDLSPEEPSLAWRSALNERVRAEAARRTRRRRTWLFASPFAGLATATAFALLVFMPTKPAKAPASVGHVEANLVALYEESVRTDDIVGSGPRPWEAPATPDVPSDPALDLEAL